jgi:hypothetical protein
MGLTRALKVRTSFKNSKYCAASESLKTGMNLPVAECREVPDQLRNCQHPSQIKRQREKRERERDRDRESRNIEIFNTSW